MFSVLPVNTPWDSLLMHENTPQGQRRAKENRETVGVGLGGGLSMLIGYHQDI